MSPLVSNDLIFGALVLFIIVSIASNTLNYMSVQTNHDSLEQSQDMIGLVKNLSENINKVNEDNNRLLQLLEDRMS